MDGLMVNGGRAGMAPNLGSGNPLSSSHNPTMVSVVRITNMTFGYNSYLDLCAIMIGKEICNC